MKFISILLLMLVSQLSWAHKVNVFAIAEGKNISVEVYFPDGKVAANSKIFVTNDANQSLFEGVTDSQGKAQFPIPTSANLKIAVDAGLGHRSEATIPKEELLGKSQKQAIEMKDVGHSESGAHEHGQGGHDHGHQHHDSIDAAKTSTDDMELMVQRAVNKAIKPLARQISDYEKKAGLTEIIGGIGYIFGILGLLMFATQRKKSTAEGK